MEIKVDVSVELVWVDGRGAEEFRDVEVGVGGEGVL